MKNLIINKIVLILVLIFVCNCSNVKNKKIEEKKSIYCTSEKLHKGVVDIFKNPNNSESIFLNCINEKGYYEYESDKYIVTFSPTKVKIQSKIYLAYLYSLEPNKMPIRKFNKFVKNIIKDIKNYNYATEKFYKDENIIEEFGWVIPNYLVNSDQIDFKFLQNNFSKTKKYSKNDVLYIMRYAVPYITTDMIKDTPEIYKYAGVNYGISSMEMMERQVLDIIFLEPYRYVIGFAYELLNNDDFKNLAKDTIKKLKPEYTLTIQQHTHITSMENFYEDASFTPKLIDDYYIDKKYMCKEFSKSTSEFCIDDYMVLLKKNKQLESLYLKSLKDIENYYLKIGLTNKEAKDYAVNVLNAIIWDRLYN